MCFSVTFFIPVRLKIEQEWEMRVIHSDNHGTVESAKTKQFNWWRNESFLQL